MTEFEKAKKYVAANLLDYVYEEDIRSSLRHMEECRCPLDSNICDAISDLMEEYRENEDLPEGWWFDETDDPEEIFFDIYDNLGL